MNPYCAYFGFKTEPFTSEIAAKNLLKLPSMVSVKERFDYVMSGGVLVITGEIGSGKSTSLRWSMSQFHPSQHLFLNTYSPFLGSAARFKNSNLASRSSVSFSRTGRPRPTHFK